MNSRENTTAEEIALKEIVDNFISSPENEKFIHSVNEAILSENEDKTIELLNLYGKEHGKPALKDFCNLKIWGVNYTWANNHTEMSKGNLLFTAASCEYGKLANLLFDLGVDVDTHSLNEDTHQPSLTPLAAAIISDNTDLIQRLLKAGASLEKSVDIASSVDTYTFFKNLIKLPDLSTYINMSDLYEVARKKYKATYTFSTQYQLWKSLLDDLKKIMDSIPKYTDEQISNDYESFIHSIFSTPDQSIKLTNDFIRKYGKAAFLKLANTASTSIGNANKDTIEGTILMVSLLTGNLELTKYLLRLGIDINAGTKCEDIEFDNNSPLIMSCFNSDADSVRILLDNNADISHISSSHANALMYTKTAGVYDLIIDAARKSGQLRQLLTMKENENNKNVYMKCILTNRPIILSRLLELDFDYPEKNEIFYKLYAEISRRVLYGSVKDPEWKNIYDTLTKMISDHKIKSTREEFDLSFTKNDPSNVDFVSYKDAAGCYADLFNEQLDMSKIKSKEDAIKLTNAQFYSLLTNPERCLPYLRFLNDELERYYLETYPNEPLPNVDNADVAFRVIDNANYPIPSSNSHYFTKISEVNKSTKHSALKNMLLALFRKHGMGQQSVKWIGFVDNEIADKMVSDGDFIIESGSAGVTILHGSLSHMLQTAILLYAIEHGDISLDYIKDGETKYLTAKELVASLVDVRDSKGEHLWSMIRDRRIYNKITFTDPHRLSSVIMKDGTRLGMKTLSDYLIDTFCKSLVKYHEIAKINIPFLAEFDKFIDMLSAPPSATITNNRYMIEHVTSKYDTMFDDRQHNSSSPSKKYEIKRGTIASNSAPFATAVANHYHPNPLFEPRSFTDASSQQYEVISAMHVNDNEAMYVTGPDPLLGCEVKASRMYYDATSSLWKFNLPSELKDRRFTFYAGAREPVVVYEDIDNDTVSTNVSALKH